MSRPLFSINRLFFAIAVCFFLQTWDAAHGNAADDKAWYRIETKHTIIRYRSLVDLKSFDRKVKYGPRSWGFSRLFSSSDFNAEEVIERVTKKVDMLFERVQEILDMRKRMEKVSINIYHNKTELSALYEKLYRKNRRIRAWYTYERNSVYVNADDFHEGILAHEIAHAIIDHYLLFRPPAASAEILARYVDSHLHEQ